MLNEKYKKEGFTKKNDDYFEKISKGLEGQPKINYVILDDIVKNHRLNKVSKQYLSYLDPFWYHYICSIPYIMEHHCILIDIFGSFIEKFGRQRVLETCVSSGTFLLCAKSLYKNDIISFINGYYYINKSLFYSRNNFSEAHYLSCTFSEINTKSIESRGEDLTETLDFVIEQCTFQFFGDDRILQIKFLKNLLKDDGVLVLFEKCLSDEKTYHSNEEEKDKIKSLYFEVSSISSKKSIVLDDMMHGQVGIDSLVSTLKIFFEYVMISFKSFNFYELIATNDRDKFYHIMDSINEYDVIKDTDLVSFKAWEI